ncbi:MAG: DUF6182 family protein [Jatrophihabitantaceae bacterium]
MLSTAPPTRLEQEAQSRLAELLAERVRSVSAQAGTTQQGKAGADSTVLVLLRSVGLADLVHGARQFAATLEADDAGTWLRSWTRTRFLFGNPANLTSQNRPRVVAPGATAAWLGPFPNSHRPGLSRLLKPVTGRLPELPRDLDLPADLPADPPADSPSDLPADLPGAGPRRVLRIAVADLSLADYLVHLHHSLAEAVLLGRLRPDEPLRLSHRNTLALDSISGPPAYARVLPDRDAGRLRLHTWLSAA